ncbi:MAG: hypothetical protein ACYC6Y_21160, partial [Thermoguttaceae bacterium]
MARRHLVSSVGLILLAVNGAFGQEGVARVEAQSHTGNRPALLLGNGALLQINPSPERFALYDFSDPLLIFDRWRPKEVVFATHEQLRRQARVTAGISALLLAALVSVAILVREVRRRRVEATLREA